MSLPYHKTLLLCPAKYSLFNSFAATLKNISDEVIGFDVRTKISSGQIKLNAQIFRFPNKIRTKFEIGFLKKINKLILDEYSRLKPDLVFIYNSEYLLPETCELIKKESKLVFFMGDSPFYTPANNHYLSLLKYADLVLSPDSFWIKQLNMLGIYKTCFFIPSIDSSSYFTIEKGDIENDIKETDVLYVGNSYVNSWGYKKAELMNQFADFNFELYGASTWKRWFKHFPALEKKFTQCDYIETKKLNKMFNKAKLIPVDGNPGIINGLHIRTLEALGSGSLPLIEYREDVDGIIFKEFGKDLPLIQNYAKVKEVVQYYLKNEAERKDLALKMKAFIGEKYSPKNNADLIVRQLNAFKN